MGFNFGGAIAGALTAGLTGGWGGAAMLAGGIGGGAGQSSKAPKAIGNKYYDMAFQRALKIYDETDFAALDESAMKEYESVANKKGMGLLEDYDALQAGGGSPISKADTNKDLSRASIAGTVSRDIASKKAELILTRPGRRKGLLPGLDQRSHVGIETRPGNADALMTLGQADWGSLFKKDKGDWSNSGTVSGEVVRRR
jgi:hypothetical protein